MYSYQDRIRAIRLYIKMGKRVGATLRQLGYPTKNALKSWHREYEQGGDSRMGFVRSKSNTLPLLDFVATGSQRVPITDIGWRWCV
jgi:transposase-like protein